MFDNSVEVYAYYDILLRWIFYLYFTGGHRLLLSLSGPLDTPYSVNHGVSAHLVIALNWIFVRWWVGWWNNKSNENMRYLLWMYPQRDVSKTIVQERESWSSGLVPTKLTSAQRLLATHKTGPFIAKNCQEIVCGGCMMSSVLPSSADLDFFGRNMARPMVKLCSLTSKGKMGHKWPFIIGLGWGAIALNMIPSIGRARICLNLKTARPWHIFKPIELIIIMSNDCMYLISNWSIWRLGSTWSIWVLQRTEVYVDPLGE